MPVCTMCAQVLSKLQYRCVHVMLYVEKCEKGLCEEAGKKTDVRERKHKYEEMDVSEMMVCNSGHYCHCIV